MRIGNRSITSDGKHQFVLSEVKINSTVVDGVKGPNYGEEQLINPSYHTSWGGLVRKMAKLQLMASVKSFDRIQDVTQDFELALMELEEEANKQLGR